MTKSLLLAAVMALASALPAQSQDAGTATGPSLIAPRNEAQAEFDTSYRPSPTVSARMQREFLNRVRWSVGVEARDNLAKAFDEKAPVDIWLGLVAKDGLEPNNVADALTAYWVLNWVAANGAYDAKIDHEPIRRQLRAAFANDPGFLTMGDMQRQEVAEGYILDFLVEQYSITTALQARDVDLLTRIGTAAAVRFRQKFNLDLLKLAPGPDGFAAVPGRQ